MKKLLLGFLAGILFCIGGVALLIFLAFNRNTQPTQTSTATQPTTIEATPTDNNPNNPYTSWSNNNGNKNIPAEENAIVKSKPAKNYGDLSAVHGQGGQKQLKALPSQFTQKNELVHINVYNPLLALIQDAKKDGISLSVVSAYRSYEHQKRIWEKKWGDRADNDHQQALKILEYSSFPGTSRHHWGTDIDFNSVSPSYWQSEEGKRVHRWLKANAHNYGFCQTYGDNRASGYANENWHWSHIPTANTYYAQINDPQILAIATSQPIKGAEAIRAMGNQLYDYIQGISPCQHVKNYTGKPIQATSKQPITQHQHTKHTQNNQKLSDTKPKPTQEEFIDTPVILSSIDTPAPSNLSLDPYQQNHQQNRRIIIERATTTHQEFPAQK